MVPKPGTLADVGALPPSLRSPARAHPAGTRAPRNGDPSASPAPVCGLPGQLCAADVLNKAISITQ